MSQAVYAVNFEDGDGEHAGMNPFELTRLTCIGPECRAKSSPSVSFLPILINAELSITVPEGELETLYIDLLSLDMIKPNSELSVHNSLYMQPPS
jgi:hypothetical protein